MIINAAIIRLAIQKLRGRPTAEIAKGVKLLGGAKIYNLGQHSSDIQIGPNSVVRGEILRFAHGGKISIGHSCYIGDLTRIWSGASIAIGNHVLIAHNVSIFDNLTHPLDWMKRREHYAAIVSSGHPKKVDLQDAPITIEDDVWIGANSIILRGIMIGQRSIVAAGSVVTANVPPDCIVAGNPARLIKKLGGNP